MSIKYEKYKLSELVEKIRNHEILLPNFQRDYVWKPNQQERLAISCILGLPVGGLLMLKGKAGDFSYREIAGPASGDPLSGEKEVYFLLDGQQRMTTLKFIFDDPFSLKNVKWQEVCRNVPNSLKVRFFLDIQSHSSGADPFNYDSMKLFNVDSLEPADLENRIKTYKVNLTGNTLQQYHHPSKYEELQVIATNQNERSPSHLAAHHVAKNFAEKGIVPLYSILYDKNNCIYPLAIHEKVIDQIAETRVDQIRVQYQDSSESDVLDLFDDIHEGLAHEIYKDGVYDIETGWKEISRRWADNLKSVFDNITSMEMPSTDLPNKEISRAAAIFEELNNSGTKLRVFDLLVARAARSGSLGNKTLSEFIEEKLSSVYDMSVLNGDLENWKPSQTNVLDGRSLSTQFQDLYLNLLSLICNAKNGERSPDDVKLIKKEMILSVSPDDINNNTERVITGLVRMLSFMQSRLGVFELNETPYLLMCLPLAYCFEEDEIWLDQNALNKAEYWYWVSLFSGRYRDRQNERCVADVAKLYKWLKCLEDAYDKGFEPLLLKDPKYNDLNTLLIDDPDETPNENVAKSIRQFVLARQPKDFSTDSSKKLRAIDVFEGGLKLHKHHLIPLGTSTNIKQSSKEIRDNKTHILNSPLNLTFISAEANQSIGAMAIEKYMSELSQWAVSTHCINSNWKKSEDETEMQYYKRLLASRYDCLIQSITSVLSSLSNNIN